MKKLFISGLVIFTALSTKAQDDLEKIMENDNKTTTEYVRNAFKSSRVINGHSIEMVGKGVLDFRILHRFGTFKSGINNLFGLDQASMRMGFDYGISKNFTIGIGRSTFNKEYDGFLKYRIVQQKKGAKKFPLSIVWVSGMTLNSTKITDARLNDFSNRLGYYHQVIAGRKFSEAFSLQIAPTFVHRNLVDTRIEFNNMVAMGIGARVKVSKRSALLIDTYPILYGSAVNINRFPLSIGFDIETGGHVFQLHITNAKGMNEKSFISETFQDWGKGEIQFGFNLSRVFTVVKNKEASW
ncbi:MAG: hypothetical protein IPK62_06340 [Bacteroidetes bacterium]|nr:hypothetical protein [Bacteroidota bacterium]MBP6314748.1 hypothetical protein [Chitinophagaceae bacterium]